MQQYIYLCLSFQGIQGNIGPWGDIGLRGPPGDQGPLGPVGPFGVTGYPVSLYLHTFICLTVNHSWFSFAFTNIDNNLSSSRVKHIYPGSSSGFLILLAFVLDKTLTIT